MNNTALSNKYNYLILGLFSISPFFGYLLRTSLNFSVSYVLVFFCILAIPLVYLNRLKLTLPVYVKLLGLFLIYTFLSDIFIVNRVIDVKYIYSNLLLGSVLIFIIIENTPVTKRFFDLIFKINHVILFIAFVVIIIQQFYDRTFFVDQAFLKSVLKETYSDTRLSAIYSWCGNVNAIGLCFFPILGLTIAHHLKNNYRGVVYLYLIGAVVAFFSKSRYIMLNYLFLLALIPVYRGINTGALFRYALILLVSTLTLYYGSKIAGLKTDKIINERILEKSSGGMMSGSAGTRLLAFKIFNKLYFKHPVWGKGYFHTSLKGVPEDYELVRALRGRSSQIHVGYLSLFYYYGLAGGIIYLLFLFYITRTTYRGARITGQWGPFFAIIQFLLTNLTSVVFDLFIMGIVIAMFYHKYYLQNPDQSTES
jgi:hypothetical protein